jgi:hypothetical protein
VIIVVRFKTHGLIIAVHLVGASMGGAIAQTMVID